MASTKTGVEIAITASDKASPALNKVASSVKKTEKEVDKLEKQNRDTGKSFGAMSSAMSNVPFAGFIGQAGAAVNAMEELKEAGLGAKTAMAAGFAGIAAASVAMGVQLGNALADVIDKIRGVASALNEAEREMANLNATTAKYRGWKLEDKQAAISEEEDLEKRRQMTNEFIEEQKKKEREAAAEYRRLSEERRMMEDSFWVTDRERRMKANEQRMAALNEEMNQREDARRQAEKDLEREEKAQKKAAEDEKKREQEAARIKEEKRIEAEKKKAEKETEARKQRAEKKDDLFPGLLKGLGKEIDKIDLGPGFVGKLEGEGNRFLQTGKSIKSPPEEQTAKNTELISKGIDEVKEGINVLSGIFTGAVGEGASISNALSVFVKNPSEGAATEGV